MATEAAAVEARKHGTLRRELRFWEAIALSIGIMAPTAAMALNGVAPAGLVGRAARLVVFRRFGRQARHLLEGTERRTGVCRCARPRYRRS